MKKNQLVTLDAIKNLLKDELKSNNEVLLLAFDRDIKLIEGKINNIGDKLDAHVAQNEKDFSELRDIIQEIVGGLEKNVDREITRHCQQKHSYATL